MLNGGGGGGVADVLVKLGRAAYKRGAYIGNGSSGEVPCGHIGVRKGLPKWRSDAGQ